MTTTLLCPHCNQYIKVNLIKKNDEYIIVPFFNENNSSIFSKLNKSGIELGIVLNDDNNVM